MIEERSDIHAQKVVYFGSCQARAISKILHAILPGEVILNYPFIQKHEPYPDALYEADVLIYQLYHPTNPDHAEYHTDNVCAKIKSKNPNVKLVCLPFINFYGYWPDYTVDPRNAKTITSATPYGTFPQQSRVLSACATEEEAVAAVAGTGTPNPSVEEINKHLATCFARMEAHDAKCDVRSTPYIRENFKKRVIFYSAQHPENGVLLHVAAQALRALGVEEDKMPAPPEEELLHDHQTLVLPCVQDELGLEARLDTYKLFDKRTVDAAGYAKIYWRTFHDA